VVSALPLPMPLSTSFGSLLATLASEARDALPKPSLVNASQITSLPLEGSLTVIALVFLGALIASKL